MRKPLISIIIAMALALPFVALVGQGRVEAGHKKVHQKFKESPLMKAASTGKHIRTVTLDVRTTPPTRCRTNRSAEPCRTPRPGLFAPGILQTGGGRVTNGPAATGTPTRTAAPSGAAGPIR